MIVLRSLSLLALLYLPLTTCHRRHHETHEYFAIHLQPGIQPSQVADALGLEYEGKLGELPDHHTFSSPLHRNHDAEQILEDLRRRRRKRDIIGIPVLDGIQWSQKQQLKPRMQKRDSVPPLHERQGIATGGNSRPPIVGALEGSAPTPQQEAAILMRQELVRSLDIRDPIFGDQWHLFNTVQIGHDINVTGVWKQDITGHNATVVMVDDGIDMYSEDLKDNYFAEGSYDFNDNRAEPRPMLDEDRHGTRCAGEIAAVKNGVCGVGVAWNAKIGGLRILSTAITDEDEAVAMNYKYQENQIYSCSWGPPDDGKAMDAPGILIRKAMLNAIQKGRGGKGTIYVFAAGNGAGAGDNCNFDGYTNSIYSITVGAIDRMGQHPYYSEKCSAQLVVTYSSGSGDAIHTTDVGVNQCYANHGGTSAAAPLGAGVFALALSVRPELTWRDLQHILVQTAVPVNIHEPGWDITFLGKKYSHTYGYGKLDAYAIVEAAKRWELVKPQAWFDSPWMHVKHPIPQGVEGLLSSFEVTTDALKKANFEQVEHVTVTMNINHTRRGDLSVELRSPSGIISHLSVERRQDDSDAGYEDWTFMSVAHWGETGLGKWSVVVKDTQINDHNGTFTDWRLTLWGSCIDASKQDLHPLPTEHDDDDHDVVTASVGFASITNSGAHEPSANPSDHIDRPVNAKPTAPPPITSSTDSSADASPTAAADDDDDDEKGVVSPSSSPSNNTTTSTSASSSNPSSEHLLPHLFPTFGVSKKTQIWIYCSLLLIILFCSSLSIYFYLQRRKRKRLARDDYEFDTLPGDEDEQGRAGGVGRGRGGRGEKGKKRRGGELYDAFAAGSEDEDEGLLSEEGSEDEGEGGKGERYRDRREGEGAEMEEKR